MDMMRVALYFGQVSLTQSYVTPDGLFDLERISSESNEVNERIELANWKWRHQDPKQTRTVSS